MMALVDHSQIRELDRRNAHGIELALLWEPQTDHFFVAVTDEWANDRLQLRVHAADALDAFHHPYAYDRRAAA
jgi:hypothetical protein